MRITLDPGHYHGYNRSPAYPDYVEGNKMFILTSYLAQQLRLKGHTVILTRTDNSKDVPVYDRGLLSAGSDLFISLHSNAANTQNVRRVVVIPPFVDRNDTYKLADKLGECVTETMGIQNEKFQRYIRTYESGGVTYDYYGVIRGSVAAGCKRSLIIEHSFHTNPISAAWLNDDVNLKYLANAEAYTINQYFTEVKAVPTTKKVYAVGDKYLLTNEDVYTNDKKPWSGAVNKYYTVLRVTDKAYLLSDIVSWVKRRD